MDHSLEPVVTTEHPTVPSARPVSGLAGKRVAFVDNSKVNADFFLSRVAHMLAERYGIVVGPMIRKAAPKDRLTERDLTEIAACAAVVLCFGDCGTSTSMSVADAVEIERRGIPTVTVFSTAFAGAAQHSGRRPRHARPAAGEDPHPMHTASRELVTQRRHGDRCAGRAADQSCVRKRQEPPRVPGFSRGDTG